jgi:type I restriction enzyme, S subunit
MNTGCKKKRDGVILDDWSVDRLGDFISLQRGHDLTWRDRRPGEIPIMGSGGPNGFHDTALVKAPGVLLGRSGASFGTAHFCEKDFWPHNTALYVTDFRGNDPLFVFYFLKAIDFTRHNSGGAQQSLNRNFIAPIAITVPKPPEQRIIAKALSDVDGLIDALDSLIAKKCDLKQAAMQQLLTGQTRLLGFDGKWKQQLLGKIAEIEKGELITSDTARRGDIPVIAGGREPAYFHDTPNRHGRSITISASGASAGYIARYNTPIFASDCSTIGESVSYNFDFLYYGLLLRQSTIYKMQTGGAQPHVQPSDLAPVPIELPPTKTEQTAIAAVLSDMDAELAALEQRREKTRALKQGMMQQLLTGQIRLV